jgi:four helix bundle protein
MGSGEINSYRDLIAWQRGMSLVLAVYRVTETMPVAEKFGLTSQMRRCAVSIPSNIAEGYGRESTNDYLRFLCVARGSPFELRTQYEISQSLGYLPEARMFRHC